MVPQHSMSTCDEAEEGGGAVLQAGALRLVRVVAQGQPVEGWGSGWGSGYA